MDLHGKMMNLQIQTEISHWPFAKMQSFKTGHKHARHQAAEVSISADELIRNLVEALECYTDEQYISGPAREAIKKYNEWRADL